MHGGGGSISGLLPSPSFSVYTTLRFTYTGLTCVYLTRGLVLSHLNVPAGTGLMWFQRVPGRGKLGIHKSVWYTQLSDLRIPKLAKYTQTGELRIPSSVRYTQLGDSRIPELLGIHKRENCVYPRRRLEAAGCILATAALFAGCGQTRPHRLPIEGALSPTKAFPVCFVFFLS